MPNSSNHDVNDSKNCAAIDRQRLIGCGKWWKTKRQQKNTWKNNSIKIEWNKSSLCVCYECHSTLLWQLCQRPKNVIRDSAYRHQSCSGFPSGRCVAAVSNVHCTLIPDPSPKHASCNYTSHRIVIEFKYCIRSERLFRSFNNMIRIIIINIQQTGSCYVIFNLKQSTWIGCDPNCVTTIPMLSTTTVTRWLECIPRPIDAS